MAVILEVKVGPFAGKRVAVVGGQTVTVGRAVDRANFALPHDTFMSGVHFAVECGPKGCVLTDHKSSNGTFVNGARATEVLLKDGDEVRSGQTMFSVRMVTEEPLRATAKPPAVAAPPASLKPLERAPIAKSEKGVRPAPARSASSAVRPSASRPPGKPVVTIGGWTFTSLPAQWEAQGEFSIQRAVPDAFPSNVVATQEPLSNGLTLQQYVESQLTMMRHYLREPQIDAALPPKIAGAEETVALELRYKTRDGGSVFYRRIYARVSRLVGVLTFTTLESELPQVRPAFDTILSGAGFAPTPAARM